LKTGVVTERLNTMKTIDTKSLLIGILAMLVVTGCLREVETEGGGVKHEPSGNELPPEPPPLPVAPSTNK